MPAARVPGILLGDVGCPSTSDRSGFGYLSGVWYLMAWISSYVPPLMKLGPRCEHSEAQGRLLRANFHVSNVHCAKCGCIA